MLGDEKKALEMAAALFDEGIYVIGESQGDSTDWDIVLIMMKSP